MKQQGFKSQNKSDQVSFPLLCTGNNKNKNINLQQFLGDKILTFMNIFIKQ